MSQTVDALLKLVALYQELGGNKATQDDFMQATLKSAIQVVLDAIIESYTGTLNLEGNVLTLIGQSDGYVFEKR